MIRFVNWEIGCRRLNSFPCCISEVHYGYMGKFFSICEEGFSPGAVTYQLMVRFSPLQMVAQMHLNNCELRASIWW